MSEIEIIRRGLGMVLAVAVSNAITLAIYFAGYPMLALWVSIPAGVTVGLMIGLWMHRRHRQ